MLISVDDPRLEQFIAEKVKAGEYASATEVVEAGLARLMLDPIENSISAEELAAIAESDEQFARGEGLDWKDVRAELVRKYFKS
jgi:Arc/MetJ-type ribon-helix-helix transcriptional regulator